MPIDVRLENIRKTYGEVVAVDDVSLSFNPGEITSLLGPSGCGKSTTLRLVAGFEQLQAGRIYFDDRQVSSYPPERRNVGMVFQQYCLFPHMNVAENIAFGLRMRKLNRAECETRTARIIDMVHLKGLESRYPRQLSGGQQQRVALARALVINPAVLLLDEPLGALDRSLRESMQFELKRIQQNLGPTTIVVTHDQEEALTLSTQVAVMRNGKILQKDSPYNIYNYPRSHFVAKFLGGANIFKGRVEDTSNGDTVDIALDHADAGRFVARTHGAFPVRKGQTTLSAVRPERIGLFTEKPAGPNHLHGMVVDTVFRGQSQVVEIDVPCLSASVQAVADAHSPAAGSLKRGADIWMSWSADAMIVLQPDEEQEPEFKQPD